MRALIVTNLYPTAAHPARGSFVRDQVEALRHGGEVEVELFTFAPGGARPYLRAIGDAARRFRAARFDVVHAHFGLSAPAALAVRGAPHLVTLHGTDVMHPRSRAITLSTLPFFEVVAPVSEGLAAQLPRRLVRGRLEILPCGVDLARFHPIARAEARRALGLDADRRYLLFPADPARPEKRFDRAQRVADGISLLTLGGVEPAQVPLWVNAADAVVVPSERESFGLAVLEALACEVPVLATPVGIAPRVLDGLAGTYCGRFDSGVWRRRVEEILAQEDPRVAGRPRVEPYSVERCAGRVLEVWRSLQ